MPPPKLEARERSIITLEMLVVIVLGVLPHLASQMYGWMQDASGSASPPPRGALQFSYNVFRNASIAVPLLWVMYRSGRDWPFFGFTRFRTRVDIPLVLLVVFALGLVYWAVNWALYDVALILHFDPHAFALLGRDKAATHAMRQPIVGLLPWSTFVLYQLSNGFAEEFVLRGYLLNRARELTGRPFLAVVCVSVLATSYHVYQGAFAAAVIFSGQLVIGSLYLKAPRTAAFAIGHGLYDLFAMLS
jgi:membrane protease YdiL (CAAX protease family)